MLLRRLTQHNRNPNWFEAGTRYFLQIFTLISVVFCTACTSSLVNKTPYITSTEPLRIVSANDGQALFTAWNGKRQFPDSLTVIDISPNKPPSTRTVAGVAPNNFAGAPHLAVVSNGRYAFIPNHPFGNRDKKSNSQSQITVVDLEAKNLSPTHTIKLPNHAWQAMAHPDDKRVIAITDHQFHVLLMDAGQPKIISESKPFDLFFTSFAISPDEKSIIATAAHRLDYSTPVELHLFELSGNSISHVSQIGIAPDLGEIDQPFAPRFSPDGKRALVLNGLGIAAKPPLDAVLSIDMTKTIPMVTDLIPNVAQGLESLAFHPSGKFAVVTCIDGPYVGHLAVIDLASASMQVLYYLPIEAVTQGIEFSPDGSKLFVQSTQANHINVYTIDGYQLTKHPYVLRTGEGPGSMGLIGKHGVSK